MPRASTLVLWLFLFDLGLAFGAGLYEHRVVTPRWLAHDTANGAVHWRAEAARADDAGPRFWAFATTVTLTVLVLANLVFAWRSAGSLRGWWLAAASIALVERLVTFSYFIPAMVGLMQAADSPESVARAGRWLLVNHARHVLVLAAWIAAARATTLLPR